ncbi:hypothetical protein N8328_00580 [Crocinitomicaceae bacterium]|nr:hypothetical protein [Crocinitomicaceae bacterium]
MIKKLTHVMVGLMICLSLFGQTESKILSEANKLFKSENFVQATPLYLRLLSLSPKNSDYNYRYGTCLLFNADKKQEALRYLKFATESPNIDPEAHFYLGKAYHLNYLFIEAVSSYNKFEELVGAKASNDKQIDRLIETCENGRRLLMNYSEMIVFDKKEIEADKFFRLYDTKDIGGTIIVTADYQSKLDKKMGHIPLIFFGKNTTEIFYSSYGEDMAYGKQIYRSKRESSGKWGDPQLIKGKVNTKFDEDYCYKSQDGKYLYFSSKGHNSMGGYDVFRSPYDASSDSFGEPENMDFAVSSPDDDIFFLVDANNENGYFASARQSEEGKLYVYKIRVDKLPAQLSIIAGQYESKITQSPAQLKVQVETLEGKVIGQFKSDKNGQIVLSFPTGGQYRYKMNLEGSSEIYIANVNVPIKKDIKPIRQSFVHFMENGSEVVRVLDRFDESVAEKDDILAEVFANKANLDPNADKFDLNSLNNAKEIEEVLASTGAHGMTMNEVASEMEGKAGLIEKKTATQIEIEIAAVKESEIARLENVASTPVLAFSKLTPKEQEISILSEVNVSYLDQKESFEDNSKDNLDEELKLDREILAQLKSEKQKLNPQTQFAKIAAISRLENQIKEDVQENELNLLAFSESRQELLDRLASNYSIESENLNGNQDLTELNKMKAKVALDEALISSLSKEQLKISKLAQDNPNVQSISLKEAQLEELIAEKAQLTASRNEKINELENLVATTDPVNTTNPFAQMDPLIQEKAIQEQIDWTYEEDKNEIAAISNSELEKIQGLIQLDKEAQKKLATEKANFDPVKNAAEIKAIARIEKSIQESLSNNQMSMLALPESDDELISKVARSNSAKRESLYANTSLSELDWKKKEIELDQELLKILANEKDKFERLGSDNPQVPELKEKADEIALLISKNQDELALHEGQLKSIAGQLAITDPIITDPVVDPVMDNLFSQLSKFEQEQNILQTADAGYTAKKENLSNLPNPRRAQRETENAFLNQEIDKINSDIASINSLNKLRKRFVTAEELRTEVLEGDEGILGDNETTIAGLNVQLKKLESYERELNALDSTYEFYEKTQNADFQSERQLFADELGIIESKKRQASISIGELETEVMGPTIAQIQVKYNDASLTKLVNEENELRVAIESDDLTSLKEARKLEKKLLNAIGDRIEKENSITAKIVNSTSVDNEDKLEKLMSLETNSITEKINIELTEKKYKEIAQQSQELEQRAKKSNSPVEQAELLSQALSKQHEASDLLEMSYVDTKIDNLTKGKINSLMTNGELESRKRNLLVEEANNAAQLAEVDAQIKNETNANKQGQLYDQRDELVKKRSGLNEEIAQVDKKISKAPTPGKPTLPENAKTKELTYLEEREIAESKYYKDLSTATYDARFLEKKILDLLNSIDQDKIDAQHLVELSLTNNDKDINKLILKKIATIQDKEIKLEELKAQLKKRQNDLQALMPTDPNTVAKINNLLARSVDPMTKGDAVDYVAIPATGFEILTPTNTAPVAKAKPISAETSIGLMYRVQVGAFSKPVAEDQFNEFTPVSAEKRSNGIFVYMAGYFVGNAKAFEAQKSIRKIGYSDAFVVAYCDGQRITLSEAKRLEETKACAPIQFNQISIQNNAPAPTDTTRIMVTELDYYKAIGAAPAFSVETKKGLFFTVQLGVYNRPVDKKTFKDMPPLITKRLPNGQIRYSTGVYVSIEEAFPKRDQAFEKGITDAFITAYYEGERISLTEAEALLRKDGTGVIEKTAVGIAKDVESRIEATKKLDNDIQEIVKNKMVKGISIQLISKNQYNEFPRDVLNRFNSHASFYYDINDKRIKSNLYSRIDDIPQVYFLRNEIDTTYITDQQRLDKAIKNDLRNVSFEISITEMGGDMSDMLLRLNYRKEFVQEGESIEVILHDVPPIIAQDISDRLRTLKIRAEVVDPAD